MWFDIFGVINATLIMFSVYGVFLQWQKIQIRKRTNDKKATDVLSLNQFYMSFAAYFSFFIHGYSISDFNHYIVWPRLTASLLVAAIIYEIWQDRQSNLAKTCFLSVVISLLLGLVGLLYSQGIAIHSKQLSTILIVTVTVLLAQGYAHQISLIRKTGRTGAVNIRMSQYILAMDISTIAFAFSMGLSDGWPLLLLASVSAITKLWIMYLFYWVRVSHIAASRRKVDAR